VIRNLNERQQRLLALAILVLLVGVLVTIAVLPVWSANRHYSQTITALEGRLLQLQRAAAIGANLQPQYQQLKRLQASDRHYLKSSSEALAAAELQRLVKGTAQASKVEVLSMQTLPTIQEEDVLRCALKVLMRGDLVNIVQMFHTLEAGNPFLFLDNVSIRNVMGRRKNIPTNIPLDADFELYGYLNPES
jgi:general secretion pathway protein M